MRSIRICDANSAAPPLRICPSSRIRISRANASTPHDLHDDDIIRRCRQSIGARIFPICRTRRRIWTSYAGTCLGHRQSGSRTFAAFKPSSRGRAEVIGCLASNDVGILGVAPKDVDVEEQTEGA
jgi:hypothetical protein